MANRFSPSVLPDDDFHPLEGLLQGVGNYVRGRRIREEQDLERQIREAEAARAGIELPGQRRYEDVPRSAVPDVPEPEPPTIGASRVGGGEIPPPAGSAAAVRREGPELPGGPLPEVGRGPSTEVDAPRAVAQELETMAGRGAAAGDEAGAEVEVRPGQFSREIGGFAPRAVYREAAGGERDLFPGSHGPRGLGRSMIRTPTGARIEDPDAQRQRLLEEEFERRLAALQGTGLEEGRQPAAALGVDVPGFRPSSFDEAEEFFEATQGQLRRELESMEQRGLTERARISADARRATSSASGGAGGSVSATRRLAENRYTDLVLEEGMDPEEAFDVVQQEYPGAFTRRDAGGVNTGLTRGNAGLTPEQSERADEIRDAFQEFGFSVDTERDQTIVRQLAQGVSQEEILEQLESALRNAGLPEDRIQNELSEVELMFTSLVGR